MNEERDVGAEILEGLRELKAGKVGRVVNVPGVAEIRESGLIELFSPDVHDRGRLVQRVSANSRAGDDDLLYRFVRIRSLRDCRFRSY